MVWCGAQNIATSHNGYRPRHPQRGTACSTRMPQVAEVPLFAGDPAVREGSVAPGAPATSAAITKASFARNPLSVCILGRDAHEPSYTAP